MIQLLLDFYEGYTRLYMKTEGKWDFKQDHIKNAYYREMVFGLGKEPYIAVQPPQYFGNHTHYRSTIEPK